MYLTIHLILNEHCLMKSTYVVGLQDLVSKMNSTMSITSDFKETLKNRLIDHAGLLLILIFSGS